MAFKRVIARTVAPTATAPAIYNAAAILCSRHQAAQIDRWGFIFRLTLVLATDLHAGNAPEIIARVFARTVDEKILLLVDHVLAVVFAHFQIRCELDGVRGAGLLAIAAKDAA